MFLRCAGAPQPRSGVGGGVVTCFGIHNIIPSLPRPKKYSVHVKRYPLCTKVYISYFASHHSLTLDYATKCIGVNTAIDLYEYVIHQIRGLNVY